MPWKLGIFDWNGTLLNDRQMHHSYVVEVCRRYKLTPPTFEEYLDENELEWMSIYWRRGLPATVGRGEVSRIHQEVISGHWNEAKLHKYALAVLEGLRGLGVKIALVSAEKPEWVAKRMTELGIKHLFDSIVTGVWPKDQALRETLEKFGVRPEEAFYVDDIAANVEAAKKLGISTFAFLGGYHSVQRLLATRPDYLVNSLDCVLALAKRVNA